jgi:hypothetical protein
MRHIESRAVAETRVGRSEVSKDEVGSTRPAPRVALPAPERPALRLPAMAVIVALGLATCSATDALSRATLAPSQWLLWAGVSLIVAPIVYRLCFAGVSSAERVALVCLLGLSLYAVKLMRDPFGYTMPDEFIHAFNAEQIGSHHMLFGSNALLPVTTRYPGLEGATSALSSLTGMSSFGAGLIVIAAARVTLMVGLYVLFRATSGSSLVAGLGAAAYAANSNFLLWGAQFSYESLALPLLVVLLAGIAERAKLSDRERRRWAFPIMLTIVAIVLTHHVTSYVVVIMLIVLAAAPWLTRGLAEELRLWPFAMSALVLSTVWLVVVASETVGYITSPVSRAFNETLKTILGEAGPRAPFEGTFGALPQEIVAFASLGVLFVALPYGVRVAWRRHRRDPIALLLCLASLVFFLVLGLRISPSAWEVANRADEFMFVGLAFVVGYAVVDRVLAGRARPRAAGAVAVTSALVVVGGAIAGWPSDAILAAPVRVSAEGHEIDSEALGAGRWVGAHVPGAAFAAPESDARTILLYGQARPLTPATAGIKAVLTNPTLSPSQLRTVTSYRLRYVLVDRRKRALNNAHGYGFSVKPPGGPLDRLYSPDVVAKWDSLPAARVFDSGNIDIFDLEETP